MFVEIGNTINNGDRSFTFDFAGIAAAYRPTPATIRVVTALLGDLCTDDKDCTIPNSECSNGGCVCSEGYAETSDRQECFGKRISTRKNLAARSHISYLEIETSTNSHIAVSSRIAIANYCESK